MTETRRALVYSLVAAGLIRTAELRLLGGDAAIGFVARSASATLSGEAVRAKTALFSGDSLQANAPTTVSLKDGGRMVLDRDTAASFRETANEVTVTLDRGNLSLYHPQAGKGLKVQAGAITIEPAKGFKTQGEVAMANGQLTVTAKEGSMHVRGDGVSLVAQQGKTVRLTSKTARTSGASAASAAGAAHGGSHAGTVAGLAAGGGGAGVGASKASVGGNNSNSDSEHTPGWVDHNPTVGDKNPIAVGNVGDHVPPQACEHAASPSVPAQACEGR